jgi:hypothetical protein
MADMHPTIDHVIVAALGKNDLRGTRRERAIHDLGTHAWLP